MAGSVFYRHKDGKVCRHPKRPCGEAGAWVYKVDVDGRTLWKGGHPTKKAANLAMAAAVTAVEARTFVAPVKGTVGQYLTGWLPAARVQMRPSTWAWYRNMLKHVEPLGHLRLQDLEADHISALYGSMIEAGKSASLIRGVHRALRRALADAVESNKLVRNPASKAKKPPAEAPITVAWSAAEVAHFLRSTAQTRLSALWTVGAMTGLRRGELLGLRWDAVDLQARTLTVKRALVVADGKTVESLPKTSKSHRTIRLDPQTVEVLKAHAGDQADDVAAFAEWDAYQDGGYVFCREDGSPLVPSWTTKLFNQAAAAAGLPDVRGPHGLRHAHATIALRAGVNVKVVSERLGHSDIGVTLRVYANFLPGDDEAAAWAVDAAVFGPMYGPPTPIVAGSLQR